MVDIIFNTFDDSIFDMYNLVCLVGDSTFVGDNDNRHSTEVLLSKAPVGSSARMICGWVIKARAMATRCF